MRRWLNAQLESYPADFEHQPIPDPDSLDQLGINADPGVAQDPDKRDT